ncbi:MAG: transcription antitermination factor NusB [Oscillospiraceae bacterium]|nr:transcription antitermination factor NusB [Oscillospiraceae bacterium]
MPEKISRRQAREQAFCLLFALSFQPDAPMEELIAQAREIGEPDKPGLDSFAVEAAARAHEHLEEIDAAISGHLKGWRLSRVSRPSLALLRLAACELLYFDQIPPGASINEAVELAKLYGDEEAPRFVNGLLGSLARELEAKKQEPPV